MRKPKLLVVALLRPCDGGENQTIGNSIDSDWVGGCGDVCLLLELN